MRGIRLVGASMALLLLAAPPAPAALSFFDIITAAEVMTGPPYPTACHRADVAHEASGVFERDGQMALGVRSATDTGGSLLGTELLATGDPPGDGFSDRSTFSVRYSEAPGGSAAHDASLELLFQMTSSDGRPGRLVTLCPEFLWSDPRRYFVTGMDYERVEITCRVEFDRGCEHELELLGEVPGDLTLTGATVALREPTTGSARPTHLREETDFFTTHPDGFFDVRFHVSGEEGLAGQSELLSLTLNGRFVGGVSPVESATWGAIKALYDN